MWTCRNRVYPEGFQGVQMTRRMVKQLLIPTEEQQLLLKQHSQSLVVFVYNKVLIKNNKTLYAHTDLRAEPPCIIVSSHMYRAKGQQCHGWYVTERKKKMLFTGLEHVYSTIRADVLVS